MNKDNFFVQNEEKRVQNLSCRSNFYVENTLKNPNRIIYLYILYNNFQLNMCKCQKTEIKFGKLLTLFS